MKVIAKKLFEGLSSALREAWDIKLYYSALDKAYRKKTQGMLSLAKIYEHGSSVLSVTLRQDCATFSDHYD